jgi:tetratricopeptide (TPR) repeat protein
MHPRQNPKQTGTPPAPASGADEPQADARFRAACEAHRRGELSQAEALYRAILLDHPSHGESLHLLGLLAFATSRTPWADELLRTALAIEPGNPRWLTAHAHVLAALGRLDEAIAALQQVLQRRPENAEESANSQAIIWIDLGMYQQKSGRPAQAIEAYLHALTLLPENAPENARVHNHLGAVLRQEGDLPAAAAQFALAVALDPAYADAHSNWGVTLHAACDYSGAALKFSQALRLQPDHPDANGHLGSVLSQLGHPRAERQLRRALTLKPGNPEARLNLGLHLLRQGNFAEGWQHYEARWQCPGFGRPSPAIPQPRWAGCAPGDSLAGTTLLIYAEQGLGDTLQFVRYLPLLLAAGARVILEVHPLLLDLLLTWAEPRQASLHVIAEDTPRPHFDSHIPLLSLPLAFATTPATIPPPIRLTPLPSSRNNHHGLRRGLRPGFRIGLCWAGNPKHALDRDRSLPLALLAPLFSVLGITFVSLQRGPAARQIEASGLPLETPELAGFSSTAAVLDTLDLVISVDTAAAHLSATQGIPTWILLPYVIDWRWNLPAASGKPGSSAWYPAARLFRQPGLAPAGSPPGTAWQPVIRRVSSALQQAAAAPSPATLEA